MSEHDHEAEILRRIARETSSPDHRADLERAADIMQGRGLAIREQMTPAKTYCFALGLPDYPVVKVKPVKEGIEVVLPQDLRRFQLSYSILRSMLGIAERGR